MKKVVFVIGALGNGGAERVISVLANTFIKKYEVNIVTIFEDKVEYELDENIKYIFLMKDETSKGLLRNIKRIHKLRVFLTHENPDCVISFLWAENIITILSCLFIKQKLILCERNDPMHEPTNRRMRIIRNFLFGARKDNYFVFQTEYAKKCFSQRIRQKGTIIFNPVKDDLPERYSGIRKKKIVCVARLVEEKNIAMLIRAFGRIINIYPEYKLYLYGRGELENNLKIEVKNLNIKDKVIFKGFSNNVHDEIKDATMFILPSNFEGISNAMIEAMAMGIPTICTDCPAFGAREFIKNGINGYLIAPKNEDELYKKILNIIENPKVQEKFSRNSYEIRDQLNAEVICTQWENFIRRNILYDKN